MAMEQGHDELAVQRLRNALAGSCSSPNVYHELARALKKLGEVEDARRAVEAGLAAFPESPENWALLGQIQLQLGGFAEAEASLRKAIALRYEAPTTFFALAAACARQGKREEAAGYRKRFAEEKAKDPLAAGRRFQVVYSAILRRIAATAIGRAGAVYARHGEPTEAERLILRAIALDPANAEHCHALAALYRSLGRIADTRVAQRRLVQLEPENATNYVNLASVSAQLGDTDSAEAALERAIEIEPDSAIAYASLAQLYLQAGKFEQARAKAEDAVRRESTVTGYMLLAAACQQLGDTTAAEAAREKARRLTPEDPRLGPIAPNQP
jgi:tetratricopeptide (TPR) repeat protein